MTVITPTDRGEWTRLTDQLRHLIHYPQELSIDLIPQGAAVKITDDGGTTTFVSLRRDRDRTHAS